MGKHASRILIISLICVASLAVLTALCPSVFAVDIDLPNNIPFSNPSGFAATYSTNMSIDLDNEFFQVLGTNGRSCFSCHRPSEGWTITPEGVQRRFKVTQGTDPIFRPNDGSNSPTADVSTVQARRSAYSMLLSKGLIRIGIGVPTNADFVLIAVDDPYGYAHSNELSLFRRPLPATNLKFLSTVMWDGRETFSGQSIHFDLKSQANNATLGHSQAAQPLTDTQMESIVAFETALFTAQVYDLSAQGLSAGGANGGPVNLSNQVFYNGINDLFGDSKTGKPFDPIVFNIYNAWTNLSGRATNQARAAVARGQLLFNTKPIDIFGVSGINDESAFGNPLSIVGTCTTCHDTPNAGDHSVVAPLNIGIADASRRTSDMPLYTFKSKVTGETKTVTDPGRALISGQFKHIGRFKGPILRGLAARAPYFHNGSAEDLDAVLDFFEERFGFVFSEQERADLVAFLRTL
jgi:cytochrome c peroxidase